MTAPTPKSALATMPTPNIPASEAVGHCQSVAIIDAPLQKVWDTLMDTSTFPSWNRFVPAVTIREQPGCEGGDLSPVLQAGTKMTYHVNMKPTSSSQPQRAQASNDTPLVVTECDPPSESKKSGRIVWVLDKQAQGRIMSSLLAAERVHEFVEVDIQDEQGQMRKGTEVRNWEAQNGALAYVVRWMVGAQLEVNFEVWLQDLKEYVEKQRKARE
ncbi:hypothetical protein BO85DRAFT_447345 [Aspergillus piperis CBS 112811]|uniref:Coenzyme Q-binding protein COQ10 START domain-containing protein n=1 Tax=Aspergillus piperis CBS 112811 TaxID=1448313 RepID=A0A8G1R765_9EURO|nr:hypothetical protein BO85DRAFT_447345 [Aspergillus piperis CBS 112811]RAH60759.1 hypothetical protein BO85DRAFT_447345 [Aspergillus piperis CBS 112811]